MVDVLNVYVVYDIVAEKYNLPFYAESHKVALRDFNLGLKNVDESVRQDYELYFLGTFLPFDGDFDLEDKPILLTQKLIKEEVKEDE